MRILILVLVAAGLLSSQAVFAAERRRVPGVSRVISPAGPEDAPRITRVDLASQGSWDVLPRYVDLEVGEVARVAKADGSTLDIRVLAVEVESPFRSLPRTRVDLETGGRAFSARCGMGDRRRGGIEPIEIEGVKVGVEVTRLLFSKMKRGKSNYNAYRHFRLQGDLRLAIWDAAGGIIRGVEGRFPLDQPEWVGGRLGNWLHTTGYGLHSAMDIFATTHGVPEHVLSPVDGTVHRVYHRDADPDDRSRSMTILIYGDTVVGPDGQELLYRLMHLSKIFVSPGQRVKAGEIIGLSGHTGFDPDIGDHVHFEMRLDPSLLGDDPLPNFIGTVPINPYNYLLEWWDDDQTRAEKSE